MEYPIARGNAGEVSRTAPCAGYRMDARLDYPMSRLPCSFLCGRETLFIDSFTTLAAGGDIAITAVKDAKSVQFAYSTAADPQSNDDFVNIGAETNVPHVGTSCLGGLDFGAAGLTVGQNITIQMKWAAGPKRSVGYVVSIEWPENSMACLTDHFGSTCISAPTSPS